jgi:hypothetical protein
MPYQPPTRVESYREWAPIPKSALVVAGIGEKFHLTDCEWADWIIYSRYYIDCRLAIRDGLRECRTCRPLRNHPVRLARVPRATIEEALRRRAERIEQGQHSYCLAYEIEFSKGAREIFELVARRKPGDAPHRISIESPLGTVLRHARLGQTVAFSGPTSVNECLTVVAINDCETSSNR